MKLTKPKTTVLILLVLLSVFLFPTIPNSSALDANLAPIPSDKWSYGDNKIIFNDTAVLHNGHTSIRVEQTDYSGVPVNIAREVNTKWTQCKPNDHIVFRIWAKTGGTPADSTQHDYGAYIGFDFYGSTAAVDTQGHGEKQFSNGTWYSDGDQNWVYNLGWVDVTPTTFVDTTEENYRLHYGEDWTLLEWDIIVPSRYYTFNVVNGAPIPSQQIAGFIAWFGARTRDSPDAWFADAELYINPSSLPPITTDPTPTPTATPNGGSNGGTTYPTPTPTAIPFEPTPTPTPTQFPIQNVEQSSTPVLLLGALAVVLLIVPDNKKKRRH